MLPEELQGMIVTGKIALAAGLVPVAGSWMVRTFC